MSTIAPDIDWEEAGLTVLRAMGVFPCDTVQGAENALWRVRRAVRTVRREIYSPTWVLMRQLAELRLFGHGYPKHRLYYWVMVELIRCSYADPANAPDALWVAFDAYRSVLDERLQKDVA